MTLGRPRNDRAWRRGASTALGLARQRGRSGPSAAAAVAVAPLPAAWARRRSPDPRIGESAARLRRSALGFGRCRGCRGDRRTFGAAPALGRRRARLARSPARVASTDAAGSAAAAGPGTAVGSDGPAPLGRCLEQQDRAGDRGVERADGAAHRDPHEEVAATTDGRPEALALAADDDGERSAQVGSGGRSAAHPPRRRRPGGRGRGGRPGRRRDRRPARAAGARRPPPMP